MKDIKKTLIQTTRALSGKSDLNIYFSDKAHVTTQSIFLPDLISDKAHDIEILKGQADRLAFSYRYGYSEALVKHFHKASKNFIYSMFMVETALCETFGVRDFPGSFNQLQALQADELKFFQSSAPSMAHEIYTASLILKEKMGQTLSPEIKKFIQNMSLFMSSEIQNWLNSFNFETLENRITAYEKLQEIFMKAYKSQQAEPTPQDESFEGDQTDTVNGSSSPIGESESLKEMDGENLKSYDSGEEKEDGYSFLDMNQAMQKFFYVPETYIQPYKAYTKAHDQEDSISHLVTQGEKAVLKQKFAHIAKMHKGLAKRLSKVLQEKLLSTLKQGWRFDQEEGVLDASKLASFIASGHSKIFRLPQKKDVMDTTVTLVVDNSGSMRGRPIEMAALTTDVLSRTLDKCGVKVEVLGFTTKAWKGGESRIDWISEGRPEHPGRLNDLLHVIYKPANKPYSKCRDNFSFMLADDLLKENIDGESLKWAYNRLVRRTESRKILIVISDGAPVDYATDRHNPVGYLDKHLKEVIAQVEKNKNVELLAIGIGHDVDEYYKNAVVIDTVETLADTLLGELVKLFDH